MPFLEHYLPFYDGIRGAPVFVEHAPIEQDSPMKRESGIFFVGCSSGATEILGWVAPPMLRVSPE